MEKTSYTMKQGLFSSSFYVINFVNECVEGIKDPWFATVYEGYKSQ